MLLCPAAHHLKTLCTAHQACCCPAAACCPPHCRTLPTSLPLLPPHACLQAMDAAKVRTGAGGLAHCNSRSAQCAVQHPLPFAALAAAV